MKIFSVWKVYYALSLIFCLTVYALWDQHCSAQELKTAPGYNFKSPSAVIEMPGILTEISGIVCVDSTTFACIQDEIGFVFIYDIRKQQIINQIPFAAKGDFEGIAIINRSVYILRSDGVLFGISDYLSKAPDVTYYETGIPAMDNEGLSYDSRNKRLLIACKAGYVIDGVKNKQLIYSFDLRTKKLSENPVFILDLKQVRKIATDNGIKFPGVKKDEIKDLDFRLSDICISPVTGKLFLISAYDYALITADINGTIESIQPLKKELFRQAEGITFNEKGDLFISNEGAGKNGTIVRFNYH